MKESIIIMIVACLRDALVAGKEIEIVSTMEWIAQHKLSINHIIHLHDDSSINRFARISYNYSLTHAHTLASP